MAIFPTWDLYPSLGKVRQQLLQKNGARIILSKNTTRDPKAIEGNIYDISRCFFHSEAGLLLNVCTLAYFIDADDVVLVLRR